MNPRLLRRFLLKLAAVTSIAAPPYSGGAVLAQSATAADGLKVPAHERVVLANGVTVLLVPRREVPLIAFNAVLRGGAASDPVDKPGVASLLAEWLEKGAGARNAYEFADAVEGAGGSFSASAGAEALTLSGQFLARDQALMLELLADVLLHPKLSEEEFHTIRARRIEQIKATKDSEPSELLGLYGRAFLFGSHPYGQPVIGSERSLADITPQEVRQYQRTELGADRLTLVFAGDIDSAALKRGLIRALGRWHKAQRPAPQLKALPRVRHPQVLLIDSPQSAQTYFWLGNVGVDKRDPRRAALDLVNTLYGGRFTSLLNTQLRIKSGLSYGASSGFVRGLVPGEFAIRSFTQTENTARALDLTLETLRRLHQEKFSEDMLESARAYVLGQYPLSLETASDWAAALAELEIYGLDRGYIEDYGPALRQVSLQAMGDVIRSAFPNPQALSIVLIGDAAKIREQVKKYGPLSEMSLTQPVFRPDAAREP